MPDDSRATRSGETGPERPLVLELTISGSRPLSGRIGPAGTPDRIAFRGWIDLMSAIHALCEITPTTPPAPS